jgi:CRISPR-associated protein Csb2
VSSSLIRCCLRDWTEADARTVPARRVPYPGRLDELTQAFEAGRRPSPGMVLHPPLEPQSQPAASVFGTEWIVFVDAGGVCPDAIAAGLATKALLRAVQAGYGPGPAPAWVSGHSEDGTPLQTPHLAAVPLLDVGWHYSHGRLMGLALILPRDLEETWRRARDPHDDAEDARARGSVTDEEGFYRALARRNAGEAGTLEIALLLPGGREWRLRRHAVPEAKSLRPGRYSERARCWATVTPIVLDRHPKAPGDIEQGIATGCERIGLPRPDRVLVTKHSAINGAPAAGPAARTPDWTSWRIPDSLAGRRLTHAVIEFGVDVEGPVFLGAGRFVGFGLCLPLPVPSVS